MARQNAPLYSLNQGEVSKLALARVDVAKLRMAAECQVNWTPWVIGPMQLRPGQQYIGEVFGDFAAKLVKFVFSKLDTALLELTPNVMRVWINDALVTRAAVTTAVGTIGGAGWNTTGTTAGASTSFASNVITLFAPARGAIARAGYTLAVVAGDRGVEMGLRVFVVTGPVTLRMGTTAGLDDVIGQTDLDTGWHSLAFTPSAGGGGLNLFLQIESQDARGKVVGSVTIDPAGALALPTIWGAGDLANVRTDQSGDIIYVACYGKQQQKIERRSTRGWSVVVYESLDGPFDTTTSHDANLTASVNYGNGTLTADRAFFHPGHVGCLIRIFENGQQNFAELAGEGRFSDPVRVVGVGTASRNYGWGFAGTWSGTISFQRSFDGPTSGYTTIATTTTNTSIFSTTGGSSGTPDLDNAIVWERVGFEQGNYASGDAQVHSTYTGGGGFGIVRVTGYVSSTSVLMEVLRNLPTLTPSNDFDVGEWNAIDGYPSSVGFHEGRLCWSGRDRLWMSASNEYTSFGEIDSNEQALGDSGPIDVSYGYGPVDVISWLLPLSRLLAGREGSIASIRSNAFDQPLTKSAISIKDCATQGAMRLPAVKVDKRGIFVQQSNRRVYALTFESQALDYTASDLTRLNLDIGKPGFVDLDVARQPDTTAHLVRADGMVAQLLYDPDDEVVAWTRLLTLGVVENVCVLPGSGLEDQVYFVVRRVINGVTRRFIEKLATRDNCVGGSINQQADCFYSYSGAPVSSVTLAWLPNTTVVVWADGKSLGTATTNGAGVCAMPDGQAHSNIVVGLGGALVIGSTNASVNGRSPDVAFNAAQGTLTVSTQYNGYPCEVFADIGGTGHLIHVGAFAVSGGVVTLPNNQVASTIIACFGYVAPFMSAKLAYAAQLGSAVTQRKKIDHVGLIMYDTHYQGVQYGQRFDALDALPLIEAHQATSSSTVWSEYDQPMVEVPGEWNTDARLVLLAQAPNPCTIGAVVVGVATNEK